ncbi:hypothetical protein TNCT_31511 [Trichonephila clavata]|uniref:Uncharacterized protein n=1 Tax=Trichonephila clavata TaxID=2740835 RepID=A0A8X6FFF8_TRICU|nr:hypothetical protein TNCT_31511 [Trichonephila clavata]
MASLRKGIARDRRPFHCKALDLAKKMAGFISDLYELKWDIPNLDKDDLIDFSRNDGERVWQYLHTYGPMLTKNITNSPMFWVMTEENFENRVHAMMEETGYHKGNFGKQDLFCIFAHILVIASWFIEHNTENMMDKVIDVVYHITLRIFNSNPIFGLSW